MYRLPITSLVAASLMANTAQAQTSSDMQNWECAIDLHQGDTGTLSLQRTGDSVDGMISVTRNDSLFKNEVSGSWTNNEISITRLLDANSNDQMAGIVVIIGTKKVKIGGRFSAAYQGVWSADCDLVSSSAVASDKPSDVTGVGPEPSTSSRISPNKPTDRQRVKFSAVATHPDGIKSISFFLGDNQIHSCEASQCDFSYGPISKGEYKWRTEALSNNGAVSSKRFSDLTVTANAAKGKCSISGVAIGGIAGLSTIYTVNLYGPDNENLLRKSVSFQDSAYRFDNVPEGRYRLSVDTGADKSVLVTPASIAATCSLPKAIKQDFEFR